MLKAIICLGRKISRDYNSTNYTVSFEAEVPASPDQPDEVTRHVNRLFQLAEKALDQEISRDQGEQAIGRRDEEPASNGRLAPPQDDRGSQRSNGNGQAPTNGQREEAASQKQINYIFNLAKRQGLSKQQLEGTIQEVLGQMVAVNQLTKREAGRVIETLANNSTANGRK